MNMLNIPTSIKIQMRATHFDFINDNDLFYTSRAVKKGASSWIKPYNKPQLIGHNLNSDPIGRVIDFKIKKGKEIENEPDDFVELEINISDKDAIEKILDGRYNTGSVGSSTGKVMCSECNQIITRDGLCAHKKGSFNDNGEKIYWIIDHIEYVENSFVNTPADKYARIVKINLGDAWIDYTAFLDNRESFLKEKMEDSMPIDAKLTSNARDSLPDSAFGYVITQDGNKIRKFPAHDAAHIRHSLTKLSDAKLSDVAKKKILACLSRRATRFGIAVADEFKNIKWEEISDDKGIDETWLQDDIQSVTDLFKDNPSFDEIESTTSIVDAVATATTEIVETDPSAMKKPELLECIKKLQDELATAKKTFESDSAAKDTIVAVLENIVQKITSHNLELEDEVNKYTDKVAILNTKYKKAIINNIIDLKTTDNNIETRDELSNKFLTRSLESLHDSLEDVRLLSKKTDLPIVTDPTLGLADNKQTETSSTEFGIKDPKFKIFAKDRS